MLLKLKNGFYLIKPKNNNFQYPKSFLNVVSIKNIKDIPYCEPYYFLGKFKDNIEFWDKIIKEQYAKRNLIPFAKDENSDDVFCFDGDDVSGNPKVYIVHTFASPGWEDRGFFDTFDEFYEEIIKISKEFLSED